MKVLQLHGRHGGFKRTAGSRSRGVAWTGAALMIVGMALVVAAAPPVVLNFDWNTVRLALRPLAIGIGALTAGVMLVLWSDVRVWAERVRGPGV